jgi:hypothetical protein
MVVPGDGPLACIVLVVIMACGGDDLRSLRGFAANPADRHHHLGDGVLGGHRVLEHHRVHSAPSLPRNTAVCAITARTASQIQLGQSAQICSRAA